MSGGENVVTDAGFPVYLDLVHTEFGGFTPGRPAYTQLLGHIGRSGLFGEMLAERIEEAGRMQRDDATVLAVAEAQLSDADPHTFNPGQEIGVPDERILKIVQLEVAERIQNEDGESPQAEGLLVNYYTRQVSVGMDPLQYWVQVNRARRHVRSQLN